MIPDLGKKDIDVESFARKAIEEEQFLAELLTGIQSKEETIRYNSFKILQLISEENPYVLYPRWDFFADMLKSKNSYWRLSAVRILANLTRADTQGKFEKVFEQFYDLLNDSVIVAAHLTAKSGTIAKAKPRLQAEITKRLLNIDKTNQKHKDLIKAGAIESFDEYFEEANNKKEILEFVSEQLQGESPKTRKLAKEFLEKWGGPIGSIVRSNAQSHWGFCHCCEFSRCKKVIDRENRGSRGSW